MNTQIRLLSLVSSTFTAFVTNFIYKSSLIWDVFVEYTGSFRINDLTYYFADSINECDVNGVICFNWNIAD